MSRPLFQLMGIIIYELRMQWRRRNVPVLLAGMAALLIFSTVLLGPILSYTYGYMGPESEQPRVLLSVASGTWLAATLLVTLAVPLVVADMIPLDQQTGVCGLLDSLPLSRAVYLTGKLLSVWLSLSLGMVGVALLDGLIGRPFHGPERPGNYLTLWAVGMAPMVLFMAGMSVLLAVGQPTRRCAVFVGVIVAACALLAQVMAVGTDWGLASLIQPTFFISNQFIIIQSIALRDFDTGPELNIPVVVVIATGIAQIALVWLLAWGWLRWREGR